ncbi:MAG TPA: acyltransferase, partial [Verrucomicrobiae bacterium]
MQRFQKHVDFLDHVRGLAILGVIMVHTLGVFWGDASLGWKTWHADFSVPFSHLLVLPFSFGWAGVSMFFVVSGFCIHMSYVQNPNWQKFFLRRFFRIYPPYFFAVLFFGLLIPWTSVGCTLLHKAWEIGTHLTLIHNFHDYSIGIINPNFWSIAVEAQLYLLYPLMLFVVSRFGWKKGLIGIAVVEAGCRVAACAYPVVTGTAPVGWWQGIPNTHDSFLGFPLMYWFSWSLGALIADAYIKGRPIPFTNHSMVFWTAMAFGSYFIKYLSSFSFTFFALLTATMIAKLLRRDYFETLPPVLSKPLRTIGVLSYSLYLLHGPFLYYVPTLAD